MKDLFALIRVTEMGNSIVHLLFHQLIFILKTSIQKFPKKIHQGTKKFFAPLLVNQQNIETLSLNNHMLIKKLSRLLERDISKKKKISLSFASQC